MTLREVLAGVKINGALPGTLQELSVAGLEYDSRRVNKDFVFFAFRGSHMDGAQFAADALARGACAFVSEEGPPANFAGPWIQVEHGRRALATASSNFFNHPDRRVRFTGITGTNGKTTTSYLLESILREAGFTTGLLGTIEYRLANEARPAPNTTPESIDTMRFAAELEQRGGAHLVSEISSHALALGRVWGFHFHTAVFTNLTQDHLDFHGTMEAYAAAKRYLFVPPEGPAPVWAVLNSDDAASKSMEPSPPAQVLWYGLSHQADLRAENIRSGFDGLHFELCWKNERQPVDSLLAGRINILNILAASGAALSYGIGLPAIARGVAGCKAVPGRFERIEAGQPCLVVVDYAHTPDALRNVIQIARELTPGRVITLFGCGGDRDRSKRPLMGMAAAELSDYVVLTSDNPRSEDPIGIMNDALVGLRRFDTPHSIEPDRAEAIRVAIKQALPGDVVLLAGKGHETYQILKDRTIHFDDRETAREALRSFGYV
ncbi:MAG: UDP-N-acetylmuramoyl-L-alanyl-D-glutamate--2,6-diaminopimelate ligase [Bryobacterales bacterium]|nr:UDP-N-acetylmuramoyl-L-alanyl-D-glutamate--2,6-diaminopimelate ligase [Bryobacterales bacterium]MBV9399100.1 UDP-N-acetylmuramoyl-L-alanyl-D-glutamate--2,6-diaminopimelate ligase [Bryobacterales bacterium]